MTLETANFVPPQPQVVEAELNAPNDLAFHMRQLRHWNHGAWRWLALAVLTGAVAALAFVRFFSR